MSLQDAIVVTASRANALTAPSATDEHVRVTCGRNHKISVLISWYVFSKPRDYS